MRNPELFVWPCSYRVSYFANTPDSQAAPQVASSHHYSWTVLGVLVSSMLYIGMRAFILYPGSFPHLILNVEQFSEGSPGQSPWSSRRSWVPMPISSTELPALPSPLINAQLELGLDGPRLDFHPPALPPGGNPSLVLASCSASGGLLSSPLATACNAGL